MTGATGRNSQGRRSRHDANEAAEVGDTGNDDSGVAGMHSRGRDARRVAVRDEWTPVDDVRRLPRAMYICAKEVVKAYTPLLEPLDLTYTQYLTMLALWDAFDRAVDAASAASNRAGATSGPDAADAMGGEGAAESGWSGLSCPFSGDSADDATGESSAEPDAESSSECSEKPSVQTPEKPSVQTPAKPSSEPSAEPFSEPALLAGSAMTLRQLGDVLYLDSGTLTPLLRKLESKGFVSRTRSTTDARTLDVSLTEAGLRLRSRTVGFSAEILGFVGLTESEARSLFLLLRKVLANLSRR